MISTDRDPRPRPVPREGTLPDLPLHELHPDDFHRLALHLLHRAPDYTSAQNYGALGDDGGIDLVAFFEPGAHHGGRSFARGVKTAVQVKRVKAFTVSSVRAEVERLERSVGPTEVRRYLLITSAVPSAPAIRLLAEECARLGLSEVEVWDRSSLTARLLVEEDLLRAFFGVGDAAQWLRGPGAESALTTVRNLVAERHRIVLYAGSELDAGAARTTELLRELVRDDVITTVVSPVRDLSMVFGDLLPLEATAEPPTQRALWQPARGRADLAALLRAVGARDGTEPILVALGLTPGEQGTLLRRRAQLARATPDGGVVVLDAAHPVDTDGVEFVAGAEAFLDDVLAHRSRLLYRMRRLDFTTPYTAADILAGRPVAPGVVHSGRWPPVLPPDRADMFGDPITMGGPLAISDLPGTGKTAMAYYVAHELAPDAGYVLDLAGAGDVTPDELLRAYAWVETHHEQAALIIDNSHFADDAVHGLTRAAGVRRDHRVQVIDVRTLPFRELDLFGGEIQHAPELDDWWREARAELADWVESECPDIAESRLIEALRLARNRWHFFFLLRGGGASVEADLASARREDFADVAWFAIAAADVFQEDVPGYREVYALIDRFGLWPLTVADHRGKWLLDSLVSLLASQRIVAGPTGFACRHQLESYAVVRLSHDRDPMVTGASYAAVAKALFKEALPPVEVPGTLRSRKAKPTKWEVREFVREHVNPALARQRAVEQAVSYDEELQEHVDEVWAGVVELVENWPPHELYWLTDHADFARSFMRFTPFRKLRRLRALELTRGYGDGDAVDVVLSIDTLVGLDALRVAQQRWRLKFMLEQVAEAKREISDGSEEGAGELEEWATIERSMVEELEELSTESVPLADMIPVLADGSLTELSDAVNDRHFTLPRSMTWLDHSWSLFEPALERVKPKRLVHAMSTFITARPLFLAHLWLLSPRLANEVLDEMPIEWGDELVEAIKRAATSFSPLHLAAHDDVLALFAVSLVPRYPELVDWVEADLEGDLQIGLATLLALPQLEEGEAEAT
ncbi:MAG: restriction endonuclease [Actinomycetota bacterium]|nr:restriction endonuclease [Actinomycetota bacterium]